MKIRQVGILCISDGETPWKALNFLEKYAGDEKESASLVCVQVIPNSSILFALSSFISLNN